MTETELKFQIPEDRLAAVRAAVAAGQHRTVPLQAQYVDTADGLLASHHIALRVRREGDAWVQTLKASSGHGVARHEHEVALDGAGTTAPPADPDLHRGTPAHDRLRQVLHAAAEAGRDTALRPVYGTEILRLARAVRHGGTTVELALDEGRLVAGDAQRPVRELEFEVKGGPADGLVPLAAEWVTAHGLWLDVVSKGERAHGLARGRRHAPPTRASAPRTPARGDVPAFLRAAVDSCLDQVLRNAAEVASGSEDADHVHQLRVGLRRLRTLLRELDVARFGLDPALDDVLADTFRVLGAHRDAELLASALARQLERAGAPPVQAATAPRHDGPSPAAAVQDRRFQQALLTLVAFTLVPAASDARGPDAVDTVVDRLDRLHRRIAKQARRFDDLEAEAQHSVRKRLKRLRYLAEFTAPWFGPKRVARYFDALKPAQDALGEHNDEAAALATLRERAATDPAAAFGAGWFSARQPATARAAGKALRRAARARPFWQGKARRDAKP